MTTYRYKLYSNSKRGRLDSLLGKYCAVYNHCLALHKGYYKLTGKILNKYKLEKHIVRLKKHTKWVTLFEGLDAQAIYDIADRIDRAYSRFFSARRKNKKWSPPKFRKVEEYKSFTLHQTGYKFVGTKVKICKKWYGFHKSREMKGTIKTVTIKRDKCGDFWLFIATNWNESRILPRTGKKVGYDFGLKTFLIASDGNDIESPCFLTSAAKENEKVSRAISSKKLGSNNRKKALRRRAKLLRRLTNRREDYQWKLANALVHKYDLLCFEKLDLRAISTRVRSDGCKVGKKRFGRKVREYGFASFLSKVRLKAEQGGKVFHLVPMTFASSQLCHVCGYKNSKTKDMRVREWVCPMCGAKHNRDRNAAMNILQEGASSCWKDTVKPS